MAHWALRHVRPLASAGNAFDLAGTDEENLGGVEPSYARAINNGGGGRFEA